MKLTKPWKTVIGILTVVQLFVGLFIAIWFITNLIPILITQSEAAAEAFLLSSLGGLLIAAIGLSMLSLGVLVFYLIHAGTNTHISTTMRVVWILLLLIFGSIVEVVYFFMEIVPEKSMTARIESN